MHSQLLLFVPEMNYTLEGIVMELVSPPHVLGELLTVPEFLLATLAHVRFFFILSVTKHELSFGIPFITFFTG